MAKKLVLVNGRIADHKVDEGGRTAAAHVAGTLAVDDVGNWYRYVRNDSAGTINRYEVVTYRNANTSDYVVTADISNGDQARPAGVYGEATAIAVSEYFWVQVSGRAIVDTENVTPTAGVPCIAHATQDGEANDGAVAAAADFPKHFGVFLAAETAGSPDTAPVQLRGLM